MGTYHQDYTDAYAPNLVGPRNQYPMGPYNPNHMGTYHQDHTAAYDPSLLATWNQEQMVALNPKPLGTHHQGQTGTYDQSLVGTYGQGQMDSHHQREIDFNQPSYMNPQYVTNIDNLTGIFQSPKLIKTRANQSPRPDRVYDGSQTARRDRSVYQNPDVQEQRPILDTSRLRRKKPSINPCTRSEHA